MSRVAVDVCPGPRSGRSRTRLVAHVGAGANSIHHAVALDHGDAGGRRRPLLQQPVDRLDADIVQEDAHPGSRGPGDGERDRRYPAEQLPVSKAADRLHPHAFWVPEIRRASLSRWAGRRW